MENRLDPQDDSVNDEVSGRNTLAVTVGAGVLGMVLVAGALLWLTVAKMADSEFIEQRTREARTISAIVSPDLAQQSSPTAKSPWTPRFVAPSKTDAIAWRYLVDIVRASL